MTLAELQPGQKFILPPPHSQTIFTVLSHHPGNPHALTVCFCAQENVERLEPTGRGTFRHIGDSAEHTFSSAIEVQPVAAHEPAGELEDRT